MAQDNALTPSIQPSGATFAQLQSGGLAGMIALLAAANPAIANPSTQVAIGPTGGGSTGGSLPAGNYYLSQTWVDGAGETTIGASRSAAFAVAAGNIPQATVPSVPTGAAGYNLYLTAAGGAAGTETLYMTGQTGTTANLSYAAPTDPGVASPAANTTGAAAMVVGLVGATNSNGGVRFWNKLKSLLNTFLSGQPVDFQALRALLNRRQYMEAFYARLLADVAALVAANHGTLHTAHPAETVIARPYRTFP